MRRAGRAGRVRAKRESEAERRAVISSPGKLTASILRKLFRYYFLKLL